MGKFNSYPESEVETNDVTQEYKQELLGLTCHRERLDIQLNRLRHLLVHHLPHKPNPVELAFGFPLEAVEIMLTPALRVIQRHLVKQDRRLNPLQNERNQYAIPVAFAVEYWFAIVATLEAIDSLQHELAVFRLDNFQAYIFLKKVLGV